jgi:hypothetical protein
MEGFSALRPIILAVISTAIRPFGVLVLESQLMIVTNPLQTDQLLFVMPIRVLIWLIYRLGLVNDGFC